MHADERLMACGRPVWKDTGLFAVLNGLNWPLINADAR